METASGILLATVGWTYKIQLRYLSPDESGQPSIWWKVELTLVDDLPFYCITTIGSHVSRAMIRARLTSASFIVSA